MLVGGDPQLFNPYEVILVNPEKHPHVNVAAANAFIDWLIGDDGKDAIAGYRVNGEQLVRLPADQRRSSGTATRTAPGSVRDARLSRR